MLTDAQKMQVKRDLGYHSVSQSFYPIIEGFASVDQILDELAITPDTETEVVTILGNLTAIEAQINNTVCRIGVEKTGSITLTPDGGQAELWRALTRWRRELSVLVGAPMRYPTARLVVV